jgi:hypothetical protein
MFTRASCRASSSEASRASPDDPLHQLVPAGDFDGAVAGIGEIKNRLFTEELPDPSCLASGSMPVSGK